MRTLPVVATLFACWLISGATQLQAQSAKSILKSLSLRDRVAQMVIGVCYGDLPGAKSREGIKYKHWVKDLHIGGLIVNNRVRYGLVKNAEPHTMALFLNQMQRFAKTPLIVGGDFERGASMRVSDTTAFPHNMAYGAARDYEASRYEGMMTAREARALGVQWVFAPDADVNLNPENPVINIRSYGENPDDVAKHVAAYIDGAHSDPKNRVLVSVKHFPGHGDTSVDSHDDLARLDATRERIEAVEMVPFRAAIAHDVDSVMTAHMAVPALDPSETPATVSAKVLTGLLREELGFKGLVVTDAMNMNGLAKQVGPGEAAIRSIEAGVDVLLMPPDPELVIKAVLRAIETKRLTAKRIDQSVQKILDAKLKLGLYKKRTVDVDALSDTLNSDEADEEAQKVADHAVTLVKNNGNLVPLPAASASCVVISAGLRTSGFGQRFQEEVRKRAPKVKVMLVDNSLPAGALDSILGDLSSCSAIVFAAYTTNPTLAGDLPALVDRLSESAVPVVFVTFGNPYLLAKHPKVSAYMPAFSTAPTSEAAAAKALFGEIPITGRMPVSIPGLAQYGDGLQVQAGVRK